MHRIEQHPILPIPARPKISFLWKGQALEAFEGETLSSALFAAGVRVFGHHAKDGAAQGIFCANGQCAQCLVLADGLPVKSCMELVRPGDARERRRRPARAARVDAGPRPDLREPIDDGPTSDVLIIGGGPAGLSAADRARPARHPDPARRRQAPPRRQAGAADPPLLRLGRGLSTPAPGASTSPPGSRREVRRSRRVRVWLDSAGSGGIQRPQGRRPASRAGRTSWSSPEVLLVAAGAREKIAGLPGQHPARRLRRRRLPDPGQPRPGAADRPAVHRRRRQRRAHRRLPRPPGRHRRGRARSRRCPSAAATRSTRTSSRGWACRSTPRTPSSAPTAATRVESVTIAEVDERVPPDPRHRADLRLRHAADRRRPRSRRRVHRTRPSEFGLPVFAAGDAEEIAEASAAMFTGKHPRASKWPGPSAATSARSPRLVPHGGHAQVPPGRRRAPERVPAGERGRLPGHPLHPGDPLQPLHGRLPANAIRIEGDARHLGLPAFVGARPALHRLREVRRRSARGWPSPWSTTARTRSTPP
ncbi:MAG: 2Fe-2S iron-sulfur cluster-binding protein [Candidatus Moduliflexus flocculans]|nr:2Fe-2S iron-sulfur cluster-binding protein [Candidatus Moduliflexus flocculans]